MDYQGYAVTIRDRIMEAVRVPVTVGIARTKTLAKLISDSAKPFGAKAVLDRESELKLLGLAAGDRDIGNRRAAREAAIPLGHPDVPRPGQRRPTAHPESAHGEGRSVVVGTERRSRLADPSQADAPQAAVAGRQFRRVDRQAEVIYAWLVRNLERLIEELEYHEVRTGRVVVWVGYRDGRAGEGSSGLVTPTDRSTCCSTPSGPASARHGYRG